MINPRVQRDCIDGVLLIDKPVGLSSNDALMRARRLLNARKAGHGGTLDPLASGLLPVAFGEATKFSADALDADKQYLAELTLGIVTESGDAEGQVLRRAAVAATPAQIEQAARAFVGEIEQIPPMYSALKRDGRPLYEYARAGVQLERKPRKVRIESIDLLEIVPVPELPAGEAGSLKIRIRVSCSKGTYIRTLVEDIGARLGCGAFLSGLRRERVGALLVQDALSLDRLEAMSPAQRLASLAPVDLMLASLHRTELDEAHARRFLHGQRLRIGPPGARVRPELGRERVRVYCRGALLGVATIDDGVLVPARLIGSVAPAGTQQDFSKNSSQHSGHGQ